MHKIYLSVIAILATLVLALSFALREKAATIPASPHDATIAVLRIVAADTADTSSVLADQVREDVLHELTRRPALSVVARSSSNFSGVPVPDLAKSMGVRFFLEGAARQSQDAVRVTVQIIDGATSYPLWAQTYDRPIDDLPGIVRDIASSVDRVIGARR